MNLKVTWFLPCDPQRYAHQHLISVWLRCLQLLPYLKEQGVTSTVNDPYTSSDIAFFVRFQDERAYEIAKQQKRQGKRIIFDLCINYFDETGIFEGGYGTTKAQVEEAIRMVELADVVTCGSEFIRKRASNFHSRTVYLPEAIDYRHFKFKKALSDFDKPSLTAIWSGQPNKARELAKLYPLLASHNISLIIASKDKPNMPGPYTYIPWTYESFPETILQGDICVSPRRTDNLYDQGHSHYKIGIFMGQGVPAICSPQPSYLEVVGASKGGRICYSDSDWETALHEILENRQLLKQWSEAVYEVMKKGYAADVVAQKYLQLFKSLNATRFSFRKISSRFINYMRMK